MSCHVTQRGKITSKRAEMTSSSGSSTTQQSLMEMEKTQQPEKYLKAVRCEFIERVSEPILKRLIDRLLGKQIISESEMDWVSLNTITSDKARDLIDMVKKKGKKSCAEMIGILQQLDPNLSKVLDEYHIVSGNAQVQRDIEEEKMIEKELKEDLKKKDEKINELEKHISEIEKKLADLEKQMSEERDEEKRRKLEKELNRESERKKEMEGQVADIQEEKREMEERHRQDLEEMRKDKLVHSKIKQKKLERQLLIKNREIAVLTVLFCGILYHLYWTTG